MSSGTTDKPILNPAITGFFSGLLGGIKGKGKSVTDSTPGGSSAIWIMVILAIAVFLLAKWYYKKYRLLETAPNIRRIAKDAVKAADPYVSLVPLRKSLRHYLTSLQASGVPASHMAFTNFHISTVNGTGLFFPAEDGVVTPDAARLAVTAGARGFVFDIWPDLAAGANFAPILQVVETGSLWRRITLNSQPFTGVLNAVVQNVFSGGLNPMGTAGSDDLIVLFLRFRGVPRRSTFAGVADALRSTIEQYRLDPSFYGCHGQDRLFKTPITELFQKVIIVSNNRATGTSLQDYINVGPLDGIRLDWLPKDVTGLSEVMRTEQKAKVQQNMSVCSLPLEDPASEQNKWDWTEAHKLGIHMAAMNFWNQNSMLKKYMAADMFGVYSYKLKEESLRFIIDILPKPKVPQNPGWGTGENAGKPDIPEPIKTV